MAFTPKRLLVFGATGNIGRHITEAILDARPALAHVAIFTSAATAANKADLLRAWTARGLASVFVGDAASEADVARAYAAEQPDTVVSALGRDALTLQQTLVRLADDTDFVQWFFPSEYGTDIEHGPASATEKPHQNKLALRRFVRDHVRRLRITYLVTGPYFDMWVHPAPGLPVAGGFDVATKTAHLIDNGAGPIGFCTMRDVGKFLVAALRHPDAAAGKALKVQSFVATPQAVLAAYETQTGGPWTTTNTTLAQLRAAEAEAWAGGNPRATVLTLRRIWAEGGTLYAKNDNELLGIGAGDVDSLEEAVKLVLG